MSTLSIRESKETDPLSGEGLAWDRMVAASPASGIMQSMRWAAFKRNQGLRTFHLQILADERLVGGCIFYTAENKSVSGLLVAPDGPVIPWQDEDLSTRCLRLILDTAQRYATEFNIMAVRIEPRLESEPQMLLEEFGRAPMDLNPRETVYLDLSDSEEEILARMKPKGRYNILLSLRKGIEVRIGTINDLVDCFYPIIKQTSQRNGFALEPLSFFIELGTALIPSGMARLLIGEADAKPLGALLLIVFENRATYLYGGIANDKRNLMIGYAMQWAAIKEAKAAGCTTYDFYGFDQFGSPENRYAKFSRFKRQFGGEVKRFIGAHDYFFLDSLADKLVRAFNEIE